MIYSNCENPGIGKAFQELACEVLSDYFEVKLCIDTGILIGNPAKNHNFDLASEDQSIVGECKCYTWTQTGNVPSAKMGFLNEAVLYLLNLPEGVTRFIVMKKAKHVKKQTTLAEYYYQTYRHLLQDIKILELDKDKQEIRIIG